MAERGRLSRAPGRDRHGRTADAAQPARRRVDHRHGHAGPRRRADRVRSTPHAAGAGGNSDFRRYPQRQAQLGRDGTGSGRSENACQAIRAAGSDRGGRGNPAAGPIRRDARMNDLYGPSAAKDPPPSPGKPLARPRVDFRLTLCIAGALVVIVMASFQIYDILRRLDIVVETAQQSYASISRTLAEQTRSAVQAVDVVVHDTATVTQLTRLRADDPKIHERLRSRMRLMPQIGNLFVAGSDGSILATGADAAPPREWVALQPFFLAHRQRTGPALFISQAFRIEGAANWTIAL